jgi:group II intron reverse transcriptase/maturase
MGRKTIIARATQPRILWGAWSKVAAGSPRAGVDGVTVNQFAKGIDGEIQKLQQQIRDGSYTPNPVLVREVSIHRKIRHLGIPTVRDRLAQRAVLDGARALFDSDLGEASFAYRRGRSWLCALREAERSRDDGLRWVFRTDIHKFFDKIDHATLELFLGRLLERQAEVDLVMSWVRADLVTVAGQRPNTVGIPQGAPISPALANRYLQPFDQAINGERGRLVRYADDLAVFCASAEQAHLVAHDVERALDALGLAPNPDKTYVSNFERGFSFLGWVFFGDDGYEEDPNDEWTHPMSTGRPARP